MCMLWKNVLKTHIYLKQYFGSRLYQVWKSMYTATFYTKKLKALKFPRVRNCWIKLKIDKKCIKDWLKT